MEVAEKVRVNRLRNTAKRRGLLLRRSRRRDPQSLGFGTYGLYDASTEKVEYGDDVTGYGLTLDDVEGILKMHDAWIAQPRFVRLPPQFAPISPRFTPLPPRGQKS